MTAARGASLSGATNGHDGCLVLVVEDDPETRHFLVNALTDHGFRTEGAHNGLQALEKAFTSTPDLVLADIAVPGIDGIELCRRLRADSRTRAIPVLAITGYDDRHYRDRALLAGADRVLNKPCDLDALIQAVRELVSEGERSSSRETA
jgi:two-component system cell cycle response regulator DivK